MTNGDDLVHSAANGLTKREYFAIEIAASLITPIADDPRSRRDLAKLAVKGADQLIAELNK